MKADGRRRRSRRHRRNSVFAAFGLVILAVPAIALLPGDGDGDEDLNVAAEVEETSTTVDRPVTTSPPTTRVPVPTITTIPLPTVVTIDPAATAPPTPATTTPPRRTPRTTVPRRPTPTTQLAPPTTAVCRNSTEPSCGDFRWEPNPGSNSPLSASISVSNAAPDVGETVTFTVSWSDADADLTYDQLAVDGSPGLGQSCSIERRFGPWTPPARTGGSGDISFFRDFSTAGDHVVSVALATADCNSPYGSERTVQVVVSVQEPPAPEPPPEPTP